MRKNHIFQVAKMQKLVEKKKQKNSGTCDNGFFFCFQIFDIKKIDPNFPGKKQKMYLNLH